MYYVTTNRSPDHPVREGLGMEEAYDVASTDAERRGQQRYVWCDTSKSLVAVFGPDGRRQSTF